MKASELRIGNWVTNDVDKVPVKMGAVGIFKLDEGKLPHQYIPKPISLTEEWLLKFGFTLIQPHFDDAYFKFHGLQIPHPNSKDKFKIPQWQGLGIRKIQYVHQLQNLYFALTGEELTITNNTALSNDTASV